MRIPKTTRLMFPDKPGVLKRRGQATATFEVPLQVVTPILGGAFTTRQIDEVDVIRVPTVRGHLRFWWRALYGYSFKSADKLFEAERNLWGGTGKTDDGAFRSAVDVQLTDVRPAEVEYDNIRMGAPGSYALWPARGTREQDPAPRRLPGTTFTLRVTCPAPRTSELQNTIRAWILFGGYGSRTRRGVGSLMVTGDALSEWLPAQATRDELETLFGGDIFGVSDTRGDLPQLGGAHLWAGQAKPRAEGAWIDALDWLNNFRQGSGKTDDCARHPDPDGRNRPSISRWPEADKVRHLSPSREPWSHAPRHNATPVWPRAGFGLPIIAQFQQQGRDGGRYNEPENFELQWRRGQQYYDRLASPLIVKAMPLAGDPVQFVPIALWLNRPYPDKGQVALRQKDRRAEDSGAPFDALEAPGDTAEFAPLRGKGSPTGHNLRDAFFGWLASKATQVVP